MSTNKRYDQQRILHLKKQIFANIFNISLEVEKAKQRENV